ncbi:SpoIIE family protein phosphatase [Sporomusa sp. KB1]|jgi:sigma-B regulation protein RsbU (phosphoserine phosphatase)|uniref:SpoIIE family protein phosphatase n=1 Tax=Sporomusa sp. KB1 TaxID=943346 RepID=UPI00119FD123|nr:SpoIIE family protein phosphatase [Sporomusa sp. KB1]TWH49281.1 sigma-B regulation protein RsbU (phosphoserine phosphatase) [Sporomusa sp. KB1]
MRNLKIGTKILAIILLVSLFSLFFISVVSYTQMLNLTRYSTDANTQLGINSSERSKAALQKQAEEYIVKIAKEQALKSDAILSNVQEKITSLSEYMTAIYKNENNFKGKNVPMVSDTVMGVVSAKYMLAPGILRTPDIDQELSLISNAEYMFAPIFKNNNIFNNIYLGTNTGISYRYSKSNEYNANYDPRARDWYKSAMINEGKSIWIDTYLDAFGSICVTNAKTFYDENGQPRGVLAADITLKSMQDDIISMKIGETGYAFLLDNKGNIIAHPKYNEINTKPLESGTGDYLQAIKDIVTHPEGLTTAHIDDKLCYIAYSQLPTTKWSLAVVVEVDEIIKPAVETKKQIDEYTAQTQGYITKTLREVLIVLVIVLAVSAMVILVFSYLLSKTITNPIKVLLSKVVKIGEGDLDTQIDDRGKDEIAELAKAFNKMTIDLKTYIRNISKITAEKERIGAELAFATKIQASMLPCIFPPFPDREEFEIYATMLPAKEVGGDFYDFFLMDDDHLAVVIADVSGKGVPAALFMVITKTLIKNSMHGKTPKEVFETVNQQLCENNEASMFVTAFMGIFEISTGEFTYVNAGHNPPLIKKANGDFEWLSIKPGFVLAGMEDMSYSQDKIILGQDDIIYMYTDGVTEAVNRNNDLFSNEKLLRDSNKYKDCSLNELLRNIKSEIDEFADGAEQADDITMLALKIKQGRTNYGH